jgi:hypothetical protein
MINASGFRRAVVRAAPARSSKRYHAQEKQAHLLDQLQGLEAQLDISHGERWEKGSEKWKAAETAVHEATYRKHLAKLEGLVISRIFEMGRLHMARTGRQLSHHCCDAVF